MSYFGADIGRRPVIEASDAKQPGRAGEPEPQPYFAAHLGARPPAIGTQPPIAGSPSGDPAGQSADSFSAPVVCPLCCGALVQDGGLLRCSGRCGARWLEETPGRLIDLAALPFGICRCCEPPRALVRGERGAICPVSAGAHLLLPDGTTVLATATPHGVCQCCAPAMPLIQRDEALVCSARPDNRYTRAGEQLALVPKTHTTPATCDTLAAIDAALHHNSAHVTVHGLFDLD